MPSQDDVDDFDDPASSFLPAGPPAVMRLAGFLWMAVGVAGTAGAFAHLFINIVAVAGEESPFARRNYGGCCAGNLFAIIFLSLGLMSYTGRASRPWIIVGAVFSLLIGLSCGFTGFMAWGMSTNIAEQERGAVYLVAFLDGLEGMVLFVAGVLALAALGAYANWQKRPF